MAHDEQTVLDRITEPLAAAGFVVEEVRAVAAGRHRTLTVMIDLPDDTADPVSLEHIAQATRVVSEAIDPLPLFNDHPYDLQVTSPGATRALSEPRHFRRVRGRTIAVRTAEGTVRGELVAVDEAQITLTEEKTGEQAEIPVSGIEHAEVVLRFR
ncbi:ribosome maturation factor RimP [Brevibacterium ihuae]|uniref:ribosome maturation factor RimP n=1 Tax=Brevibacterium ihuae TaxID=1631743 RepID=UPI000C772CD4|nr:ribosome assembly cofactor RimP [Brevibacterium ihuae]